MFFLGGGGRGRYIGITLSPLSVSLNISCQGHNFLPSCLIWIIFRIIVVHDPKVCHDLDPRPYLQGQGQCTFIPKIRVQTILHQPKLDLDNMWQRCVMILTKGHISEVKVKVHIYWKSMSRHNSLLPNWMWIIFFTLVVQDRRMCYDLDQRLYFIGQGHSLHIP